jgi:hypothetical protein
MKIEAKREKTTSPADMLGSSLAAAAAAAASAAAPLASALPIQVVGSQLQSAAAAGECSNSNPGLAIGPTRDAFQDGMARIGDMYRGLTSLRAVYWERMGE